MTVVFDRVFSCRGTPSVMSKNYGATGATSRRGQTYLMFQRAGNMKGSSPRPSIKAAGANEHAAVTLDDVKSVALDSMPDVDMLPPAFQECYRYRTCRHSSVMVIRSDFLFEDRRVSGLSPS